MSLLDRIRYLPLCDSVIEMTLSPLQMKFLLLCLALASANMAQLNSYTQEECRFRRWRGCQVRKGFLLHSPSPLEVQDEVSVRNNEFATNDGGFSAALFEGLNKVFSQGEAQEQAVPNTSYHGQPDPLRTMKEGISRNAAMKKLDFADSSTSSMDNQDLTFLSEAFKIKSRLSPKYTVISSGSRHISNMRYEELKDES